MTEQEQMVAIAEACGKRLHLWTEPTGYSYWMVLGPEGEVLPDAAPDYLNDLNAMNVAMRHLKNAPCGPATFLKHLLSKVCADYDEPLNFDSETLWCAVNATAAQRAEAFLRTIGKWKEEPCPANMK